MIKKYIITDVGPQDAFTDEIIGLKVLVDPEKKHHEIRENKGEGDWYIVYGEIVEDFDTGTSIHSAGTAAVFFQVKVEELNEEV